MTSRISSVNGRITFYANGFTGITILTDIALSYTRDVIERPGFHSEYFRQFFPGEETIEINFVTNAEDASFIIDGIRAGKITHYICEFGKYRFSVSCKIVQSYEVMANGNMCDFTLCTIGGMTQIDNIASWQEVYSAIMSERGQRSLREMDMTWKM